jgi:hypothetical protein
MSLETIPVVNFTYLLPLEYSVFGSLNANRFKEILCPGMCLIAFNFW